MRIHPVIESFQMTYKLDPERGNVRVKEAILEHPGIESIQDDDKSYYVRNDGSFEVPEEVAKKFVGKVIGGVSWYAGPSPLAFPGSDAEPTPARTLARRK